jgi:hypothetical protein
MCCFSCHAYRSPGCSAATPWQAEIGNTLVLKEALSQRGFGLSDHAANDCTCRLDRPYQIDRFGS